MEQNMHKKFTKQFKEFKINEMDDYPNCGVFVTFQELQVKV